MKTRSIAIIVLTSLLLLGLVTPGVPLSADNAASWDEIHVLVNSTLDYILKNHADAPACQPAKINWCLVTVSRNVCSSGYKYTGGGWTVNVCQPDTAQQVFEIKASYENPGITWTGIARKGLVTETSYSNPSLK